MPLLPGYSILAVFFRSINSKIIPESLSKAYHSREVTQRANSPCRCREITRRCTVAVSRSSFRCTLLYRYRVALKLQTWIVVLLLRDYPLMHSCIFSQEDSYACVHYQVNHVSLKLSTTCLFYHRDYSPWCTFVLLMIFIYFHLLEIYPKIYNLFTQVAFIHSFCISESSQDALNAWHFSNPDCTKKLAIKCGFRSRSFIASHHFVLRSSWNKKENILTV